MSIIEVIGEVVAKVAERTGEQIRYTFGSSQYVKDELDTMSKSRGQTDNKLPLIALFCPIKEDRTDTRYATTAPINLIIACSTTMSLSNEERLETSFKKILRPIYDALITELLADVRIDWGYDSVVRHKYSENYSYGRYGAYTEGNDKLSEPIDAIDLRDIELKLKNSSNCRRK